MTKSSEETTPPSLRYWDLTMTKGIYTTIIILYNESEVEYYEKKYKKLGYICKIEKKF
jgi:hypothetical protein